MRTSWLNKVLPVLALLALIGAVLLVARSDPVETIASPPHPPPVSEYRQTVAAVGLVEPSSELIAISTPVPGMVTAVHVAPNSMVTKGAPLFSLDDRDLRAEHALRREALRVAEAKLQRLVAMPRPEEIPAAGARVAAARSLLADANKQLAFMEGVTDQRAIQEQELSHRRYARDAALANLRQAEAELELLCAGAWKEDIEVARQEVAQARAVVERVRADLDRLTVRAPVDGMILKLDVRVGEYAPTGRLSEPLIVMGNIEPLHVRVDINEEDSWRVQSGIPAIASVRGDSGRKLKLSFVRFEPYVIPKRHLSGASTERVDTRVLQAIYRIERADASVFVGQQLDVFIDAGGRLALSEETQP